MLDAVIFVYLVSLGLAAFGALLLLFPFAAARAQRWICTLPLYLIGRRPAPFHPRKGHALAERMAGAVLVAYAASVFWAFPIRSVQAPQPAPAPANPVAGLLATHIQPLVTRGNTIGAAAGIILSGRQYTAGYGRLDARSDEAPDADTVFEIGSVTKVFTAAALASMAQRGDVRMDEPVQKLLPAGIRMPARGGRAITLRHLATHTSGLPRVATNMNSVASSFTFAAIRDPYASYGYERLRAYLNRHQLAATPGEQYLYSNFGMGLLGYALARRSGRSYGALVEEKVCRPLGLRKTSAGRAPHSGVRRATGYFGCVSEDGDVIAAQAAPWTFQDTTAGAGALCSTVNDLLRFLQANMGDAPDTLRTVLQRTHSVQRRVDAQQEVCLAWHTLKTTGHPAPVLWHNGGTGGYSSFVGFCRAHGTAVVLLCNISPTDAVPDRPALDLLFAACDRQQGRP